MQNGSQPSFWQTVLAYIFQNADLPKNTPKTDNAYYKEILNRLGIHQRFIQNENRQTYIQHLKLILVSLCAVSSGVG